MAKSAKSVFFSAAEWGGAARSCIDEKQQFKQNYRYLTLNISCLCDCTMKDNKKR